MNWAVTYMLLTLLGFALNLLAAMPFTMSYYILSDNSDIKEVQALKASAKAYEGTLLGIYENALKFCSVDHFFHIYIVSGTDLAGALYRNLYGSFLSEYFRRVR